MTSARNQPRTPSRRGSQRAFWRGALLACLACHVMAHAACQTWDFSGCTSKAEALARATSAPLPQPSPALKTAAAAAPDASPQLQRMFDSWAGHFSKRFASTAESAGALRNFKRNMQRVYEINSNPNITYWASGNQFSHLSYAEFKSRVLMQRRPGSSGAAAASGTGAPTSTRMQRSMKGAAPDVNWVTAGKVTAVKDQLECGSCWAFAAVSVLESMYLIQVPGARNDSLALSEQQLVSCANERYGWSSAGCDGGMSDSALDYVSQGPGLASASAYPYTSGAGATGSCRSALIAASSRAGQVVATSGRTVRIQPANSEAALMRAVADAPTTIYFDVEDSFQHYSGGVYSAAQAGDCSADTNHAMVAVGYSTSGSKRYWLIRNSWSAAWGEAGYVRVQMSGDGIGPCGMYQESFQPPTKFVKTLAGATPVPSPSPSPSPRPVPSPTSSPRPVPVPSPSPVPVPSGAPRTGVACDGRMLTLTCGVGQAINIRSAVYGRADAATCPTAGSASASAPGAAAAGASCSADLSVKLRAACGGRSLCNVFVLPQMLGGDPCPAGTLKYLNVAYSC